MPDVRNKYQYGDLIMFRPSDGIVSRLISKVDGSEYSHVGVFWKYVDGVPLFIESHEARGGVVINKLQEWGNFDVLRSPYLKPRPQEDILRMVGNRYDYSLLWWIFKARILKRKLQNNDSALVICSELADFTYYYTLGNGQVCTPKTVNDLRADNTFKLVQ